MTVQIECPSCGRPAGERCRTRSGLPLTVPHAARTRRAGPLSPAALDAAKAAYAAAVAEGAGHWAALEAAIREALEVGGG